MTKDPFRHFYPFIPSNFVRRPKVNTMIYPNIHHVRGHVRKFLIFFGLLPEIADSILVTVNVISSFPKNNAKVRANAAVMSLAPEVYSG